MAFSYWQRKFHAQMSWARKSFITSGPGFILNPGRVSKSYNYSVSIGYLIYQEIKWDKMYCFSKLWWNSTSGSSTNWIFLFCISRKVHLSCYAILVIFQGWKQARGSVETNNGIFKGSLYRRRNTLLGRRWAFEYMNMYETKKHYLVVNYNVFLFFFRTEDIAVYKKEMFLSIHSIYIMVKRYSVWCTHSISIRHCQAVFFFLPQLRIVSFDFVKFAEIIHII